MIPDKEKLGQIIASLNEENQREKIKNPARVINHISNHIIEELHQDTSNIERYMRCAVILHSTAVKHPDRAKEADYLMTNLRNAYQAIREGRELNFIEFNEPAKTIPTNNNPKANNQTTQNPPQEIPKNENPKPSCITQIKETFKMIKGAIKIGRAHV